MKSKDMKQFIAAIAKDNLVDGTRLFNKIVKDSKEKYIKKIEDTKLEESKTLKLQNLHEITVQTDADSGDNYVCHIDSETKTEILNCFDAAVKYHFTEEEIITDVVEDILSRFLDAEYIDKDLFK